MKDLRSIADRVKDLIASEACVDEKEVTPDVTLRDDLGMDSLDLVEITMGIEEEILDSDLIPEDEAEGWETVEDVIAYVERRVSAMEPKRAQRKGGR
jgi:acyl carrier protein